MEKEAQKNLKKGFEFYEKDEYLKAIEYWSKITDESTKYFLAQYNIGLAYVHHKSSKYQDAILIWSKIPKEQYQFYTKAQWNMGAAYIMLDDKAAACQALINTENDVLGMLRIFNNLSYISATKTTIKKVLDAPQKEHDFFNTTVMADNTKREKYKEIFIQSLFIINLLHVDSEQEKHIAHYTRKWVVEQMFFAKSPLRLSTVIGANDPKEGITLLDFLDINNKAKSRTPYQAFITCFTFNHESLNQFRLYGKEDNKEATGVSVIVNKSFFSDSATLNVSHTKNNLVDTPIAENENGTKKQGEKYSLYRCIYIDPETKMVISLGHKEEYSFYREIKKNKPITITDRKNLITGIKNYKTDINTTLEQVRKQVKGLNAYIKKHKADLDESIISELLLPLRHLTKHVAFKEEQECRIFDIENLKTSDIIRPKREDEKCTFGTMHLDYDADISEYVEKVIFAPMTPEFEQFKAFTKYKGYDFPCERCDHPFSSKTT